MIWWEQRDLDRLDFIVDALAKKLESWYCVAVQVRTSKAVC